MFDWNSLEWSFPMKYWVKLHGNLDILALFEMCCCYLQDDLKEKIERELDYLFTVENVFSVYSVATKHNATSLLKLCFDL